MENEEIKQLIEGFETVWQRVGMVPEEAMEVQAEIHQCALRVTAPMLPETYQPRWFCVF